MIRTGALALLLIFPMVLHAGYAWEETQPAGDAGFNWFVFSSDDDRTNILGGGFGTRLYYSTNGGTDWAETQPAGDTTANWLSSVVSDDGSLFMSGRFGGRLYISTTSAASWTEVRPAGDVNLNWRTAASDADGSNLIVGATGGRLYVSTTSGATWTETQPAGAVNINWQSVASDEDGSVLVAGVNSGRLYVSTTSGTTWTETQPAGATNQVWQVASDADGSTLVAVANGGRAYLSTDSGTTWGEVRPIGDVSNTWQLVASNDDGSTLFLGANADRLYVSEDGGDTWQETQPAGDADYGWGSVDMTDDGLNTIASRTGAGAGRVYLGTFDTTAPTVTTLSPADNATDVALDATFTITFDEDIATSTGNILLKESSGGTTIETIDITGPKVTASGTTALIIDPTTTLTEGTHYHFTIANTAIEDLAGNAYAGMSHETTWDFTTIVTPEAEDGGSSGGGGGSRRSNPPTGPTQSGNDEQIVRLQTLIVELKAKLAVLLAGTPALISNPFTRDLEEGSEGTDVTALQAYLTTQNKGPAAQALANVGATGYFGPLTKAALAEFQVSVGITPPAGYFGPKTRVYLESGF